MLAAITRIRVRSRYQHRPASNVPGTTYKRASGRTEPAITLETGSDDRVGNMHAFTAAALDLLLDVLAAEAGASA